MDFETSEWNVPSDADGLTASLFGKLHDHNIKRKSKIIKFLHDNKKEQKINVADQCKKNIMTHLERKKLKIQNKKLKKLKNRDQGISTSKGDNCRMCGDDRKAENFKCISLGTKDNDSSSVKRKSDEMDRAMKDNDISLLPRKKAKTCLYSGPLPVDIESIERSKSDKSFRDGSKNENSKREKSSDEHTVNMKDNSKRKKKGKRRSKKNKFKVELPVKIDEHVRSVTSEKGFSTNMKKATNQSLLGIIQPNLVADVEDKAMTKKKRSKYHKKNFKSDSDQKNDKDITYSSSVRELHADLKEADNKNLTASVPKQNEVVPKVNKNEVDQRQAIISNKFSKPHKSSPFNVEKLNILLDEKHEVSNAIIRKFSDKGSSIKEHKQPKNDSQSSSASLKEKMLERLSAARFRYLNEQLYTTTGEKAFQLFKEDADSFAVYHAGFQGQVEKWPNNPVDLIIRFIQSRPKHLIIADFGCGDAKIARSVPNKVYSFDLAALNEHVTVCNMARVPLTDNTVDIAVFCLSLMGTNLADYIREAHRVLKNSGILKIAEVQSRFQNLGAFVKRVEMLGFKLTNQDAENKMFIMMDFKKSKPAKSRGTNIQLTLDPCVYKKR